MRIAKCRNFAVDITRETLEDTNLGADDKTYKEGRRTGTGNATILYDESDQPTRNLLNSIFANTGTSQIQLVLNTLTNRKLTCHALLTQVGTPVSVREATACSISFQVSDAIEGGF